MLIRREPDELAVTWAFSTDVLKSISGKERRIANRTSPLERISARYFIAGDPADADAELMALRAALFVDPVSSIEFPIRIDSRPVTAAITGITAVLDDITYVGWIAVGQAVYVEGATADDYYTTSIDGSVGATLSLADSPPGGMSFPAGVTTVSPIATLLPDDKRPLARYQESHGQLTIAGVVSNVWASYGGETMTVFGGFTVLTERPITENDLFEEQFEAGLTRVESLPGAITQTWDRDFADIGRIHRFNAEGDFEREWWRTFLSTVKGQQKAFLLPTWRPDLTIISAVGTTLQVDAPPTAGAIDYVNDYWPSLAHRRLMFARTDGSVDYYTVSAAVDNLDGTADLTLSPNPDDTDLDFISLLETCRLAEDEVTFERGSTAMDFDLSVFTVQQAAEGTLTTSADYEKSVQASRPIELVKITGSGVAYYMTGERADVSYGGNTYVATAGLARSTLEQAGADAPRELEIVLPLSCDFVQENVFDPADDLEVTVYRQNAGGTVTYRPASPISSILIRGALAVLRAPSQLDDPLTASLPGFHYQRLCNHRLYDSQCGIATTAFDLATTIATVSGRTITVNSVAGYADGDLDGGEIVHANGSRKMIVSHVGTTLVLASAGRGWVATNAVTLLRACDKKIATCFSVFANVINFGGHPNIPKLDLFLKLNGRGI